MLLRDWRKKQPTKIKYYHLNRRKNPHMTQQELADLLGCCKLVVSNWEKGHHRPSNKFLCLLKEITKGKVTANDFF